MPHDRRSHRAWGVYFLTLVTHERRPLFWDATARNLLRDAMDATLARWPMTIREMVLLPDHLHMLVSGPQEQLDYSLRVRQIKSRFTRAWLAAGGSEGHRSEARCRSGDRGVWQKRFYEHTIRNQRELCDHVVYVHMNPVGHGLVTRPVDWPWSTFHRHVRNGTLDEHWQGPAELRGVGACDSEVW